MRQAEVRHQSVAPRTPGEWIGLVGGALMAPVTGAWAAIRRARTFHPDGVLYRAEVSPLPAEGEAAVLGAHLAGPALVRFSSALWTGGREWIDVLGCSIRFRSEPVPSVLPAVGDQDLLCATLRTPLTTLLAPLRTHRHDFLRNDYYAVSPFLVEGLGKVKFRVVTGRVRLPGSDRGERLQRAVEAGLASLRLEWRPVRSGPWQGLCAIRPVQRLDLDQEALRFDPFRNGRGLRPAGLVQYLRPAAYWASQRARPRSAAERTKGAVRKPLYAPVPVEPGAHHVQGPQPALPRRPPPIAVVPLEPQRPC